MTGSGFKRGGNSMKHVFVGLMIFFAPAFAFAQVTVVGLVTVTDDGYQIQEADGQILGISLEILGGSVCGQAIQFEREMKGAVGNQTQLTGDMATDNPTT